VAIPGYSQSQALWLVVLLTGGVIAVGAGAAGAAALAVFSALVAVCTLFATWRLHRAARSRARLRLFFRFPGGFIDLIPDEPGPRVLRWSDSDSVTLVFNDSDETYNGLSTCTLSSGSRTSIKPPYGRQMTCELAREAKRILAPKIIPSLIGA